MAAAPVGADHVETEGSRTMQECSFTLWSVGAITSGFQHLLSLLF